MELGATITAQRPENVPREALRVDSHQHVLFPPNLPLYQGQVESLGGFLQARPIGHRDELPVLRGELNRGHPLHQTLASRAVLDQLGDGEEAEGVGGGKTPKVVQASHGSVFVHDLADDPCGRQPRHAGQIHRRLRVPRPAQHPSGASPQRENVSRHPKTLRLGVGRGQQSHRVRPFRRRDPRGGTIPSIHRHRERSAVGVGIPGRHGGEPQGVRSLRRQGSTDEPPSKGGHEIHHLRSGLLRRRQKVSLVFPVLVVHHNDHAPRSQLFQGLFHRAKHRPLISAHYFSPRFSPVTASRGNRDPLKGAPGASRSIIYRPRPLLKGLRTLSLHGGPTSESHRSGLRRDAL
ncbi:MAG: hypothetical protein BWY88_00888 [Synergistetes bacterium ADurb.Bin520]|nr:MAG: hypothetical protein BWY88_00888 [Synergistetes bacterium ADurb.Bin520]